MTWNVTNLPTDKERIRKLLKLPANKLVLNRLQAAMDQLLINSSETIATVQANLEELDSIKADMLALQTDPNYRLIKADVLEWESGVDKDSGLQSRWSELIEEIIAALDLDLNSLMGGGYGNGTLCRS